MKPENLNLDEKPIFLCVYANLFFIDATKFGLPFLNMKCILLEDDENEENAKTISIAFFISNEIDIQLLN